MKTLLLSFTLIFSAFTSFAQDGYPAIYKAGSRINKLQTDSIKLRVDGTHAYYQKVVKVDSNIVDGLIYERALQFMASKNIQQNYEYEEQGKFIFTTVQDLNINPVYVGDDNDSVDPYTAQFAITLDLKKGRYRYTIDNVVFFRPTETGNKRQTLYEVYLKATNTSSKRIARDAGKMIASFERYIDTLTHELYEEIEYKSVIYNPKF